MRALITGGSGFIGQALTQRLIERGDQVTHLVRRAPSPDAPIREIRWNPSDPNSVDPAEVGQADVVFNFSGATVAKRWTQRYKRLIADSRIETTRNLIQILKGLEQPPRLLITASGLAIYGDRGEELLTESSGPGSGFLAGIAIPWEEATNAATELGCRAVTARFGMVMSGKGGGLPTLARPFRFGMGGRLGNGRQWTPWIHLDDAINALLFITTQPDLKGPVIVAAPGVARNSDLSKTIGKAMGRPALLWMPAIVARLLFGQFVQELALASARAAPEKLMQAGFQFRYPDLVSCLKQEFAPAESA